MSKSSQHDAMKATESIATSKEWNRTIPQAGYIKLGSIRYGVQITNLNLQDYPLPTSLWTTRSNKPAILSAETASSSIMSPSANNNAKAICSDECCCCISSSSTSSKTRLPISQSAKNRTSSPSSTSLQRQQTIVARRNSVLYSNFQREASPTVCCLTGGKSQFFAKNQENCADQNEQQVKSDNYYAKSNSFDAHKSCENRLNGSSSRKQPTTAVSKSLSSTGLVGVEKVKIANTDDSSRVKKEKKRDNSKKLSCFGDKIGRIERQPPNNNHHLHENNIINRTTTITRTTDEEVEVSTKKNQVSRDENDPDDASVSENIHQRNKLVYSDDDGKNSQSQSQYCTLLINRHSDESRSIDESRRSCIADDSRSDEKCTSLLLVTSDNNNNSRIVRISDLPAVRIESRIPRQLSTDKNSKTSDVGSVSKSAVKQSDAKFLLHDNDFSFIDSSSRSSSASIVSYGNESVNRQRKYHIPNVSGNNDDVQEFSVERTTCANQNIHSLVGSKNDFKYTDDVVVADSDVNNLERLQHGSVRLSTSINLSNPENNPTNMDKSTRSSTLKKFGFGRKTSSSASTSPERRPQTSKTERLRELTEKLKGHKYGSFKINSSRSMSPSAPPIPPPMPQAPVPPPRRFGRKTTGSNDISASSSMDDLDGYPNASPLHNIGKSKSVEPASTSIFARQIRNIQERFLRPNVSTSNLEVINKEPSPDRRKTTSLNDQDIFTKLQRPESRAVVGSYTQKAIPFRSASFSQADVTSGKYVKSDLNSLRASLSKRSATVDRSPSPSPPLSHDTNVPAVDQEDIPVDADETNEPTTSSNNQNSEFNTINEEELQPDHTHLNVVQANEVTLETLIEEDPVLSVSPKLASHLQQAMSCTLPIPVFECVEKEWSPMPEGGHEFCNPISHNVLPEDFVTESFIEVLQDPIFDAVKMESKLHDNSQFDCIDPPETPKSITYKLEPQFSASSYSEDESKKISYSEESHLNTPLEIDCANGEKTEEAHEQPANAPDLELNTVALQLDEISEKLKKENEVTNNNIVKTQIPQSKEELITQKSVDSYDEIHISPEIQEVLETVAETLNEEHEFLKRAVGAANISIASLICPETAAAAASNKGSLLKVAADSSPEPGSFDKSDVEFTEVRKRYSNEHSGSEKSSPNASPNTSIDEKKRIDKSRRRKGIYIQWPAIETSQDSFDSTVTAASSASAKPPKIDEKTRRQNFAESKLSRQSESMGSFDPCTPDSDHGGTRALLWPKASRRQSLSNQSSDERDDFACSSATCSPPIRPFRNIFLRSDSVSDNELSDRSSRDRSMHSIDFDLKRYSKRPLRGPYGQMLEAEMKKPNKVSYDGILEELQRSDSLKKSNCSLDSTSSRGSGFFSRVTKSRKSHTNSSLPLPTHQRTASSPVPLIETTSPDAVISSHRRFPSSIEHHHADKERPLLRNDSKKLSFDSHLSVDKSPKRTSSDTSDKHSKKSHSHEKLTAKRSLDEIRMSSPSDHRTFVLHTPETPKNMNASPELLAELLKGSSEKAAKEQNKVNKHTNRSRSSENELNLPPAVMNCLNSSDFRTHVVVEIFDTEKSYVEALDSIVKNYLTPLKLPESSIVDIRTVNDIFYKVPEILEIHERFVNEMKKRLDTWDQNQKIGDSYNETFSNPAVLETYTAFVNNWSKAKDAIRTAKLAKPAFSKFLEEKARENRGKLSLDALLIKIIQKFPNYKMMLSRLIKHTEADHPDHVNCSESLKLVHDILAHLNDKEREALLNGQREATLRELENVIEGVSDLVTDERTFLSFEIVSMPSPHAGRKERGFFLFNDLLVIASIKKKSGTIKKPHSVSGSFASTLDTNKYKFLLKIPLDDLEIVKSKDENVRRIMKEIETLSVDSNKLQQMLDIASTLRCQHQLLEESLRELQQTVQRQLTDRQSNDSQLNVLDLNVNEESGTKNMQIVFSKTEKRTHWEELFTDAKQKLNAMIEKFQVPELLASLPLSKTRAGLRFTCASPTIGTQKDVWVCNSDGYVGQVCVLSLNQPDEPAVTSCNGVCNARILSISSVPGYSELTYNSSIIDEHTRSSLISISTDSMIGAKHSSLKTAPSESSNQIDLSSSDSEPETQVELSMSPNTSQVHPDETESQMWLGTEDGFIHVYNCTDNIRTKKNKIRIQHVHAVQSILYLENRVYVSLANGDVFVYKRGENGSSWNISSPVVLSLGAATSPVTRMLNVYGKLWCSVQGVIKILNTTTLQVENIVEISNDSKPISNMTVLNEYVWTSLQNSAIIYCSNINTLQTVYEVNLAPSVDKMLSNCDNIIQQHKAACLRVTALLACKDIIWVGTSAGVLLTVAPQSLGKANPIVTGIPQGHTGHVRFLTSVETSEIFPIKKQATNSSTDSEATQILIISGGDGFEDFRTTEANEVAGREDSTNHLLMWRQIV